MKTLNDINLNGKRVLIRVDFNVPVKGSVVTDNFRIRAALPTIQHCLKNGAAVVLMSHMGRPKSNSDNQYSLEPVFFELEELLGVDVYFSDDCVSNHALKFSQELMPGEIHLLENLRFHSGEIENNEEFAGKLAGHSEIFINDAFGTAHRSHASNVGIVDYMLDAVPGFLMEKELKYLSDAMAHPEKPFIVVLGGAKVEGKIELIQHLLDSADDILIGGKMAFSFLSALGKNCGGVSIEKRTINIADQLLKTANDKGVGIVLPSDFVTVKDIEKDYEWDMTPLDNFTNNDLGLDIGPESCSIFEEKILKAKTILWNGPMGVFENFNFSTGTNAIASAILHQTDNGAISIVGGGDTASAVRVLGLKNNFSHISTGGGASLELLSGRKLPAVEALKNLEYA